MPEPAFDYAIVRVVPRVERHEFVNAGVIAYCATRDDLRCRVGLPRARLQAIDPKAELDAIERHLFGFAAVCRGDAGAGPIAALPTRERFHWLVGPRSAVIQTSPVHAGHSADLGRTLDRLFAQLVGP